MKLPQLNKVINNKKSNVSTEKSSPLFVIKKGLKLPINGEPSPIIDESLNVKTVALLGRDYLGLKPSLHVEVGDRVQTGQVLFNDKKNLGVQFVAPGSGQIIAINRGAKRALNSIVIALEGDQKKYFNAFGTKFLQQLNHIQIKDLLIESGLWTTLRTRPFNKVPFPDSEPHSIFINAMDTNPLAINPEIIIQKHLPDFDYGVQVLTQLTTGNLYLCKAPQAQIGTYHYENVVTAKFTGKHPAGLTGTHIHFLDPVDLNKTVWTINYQDVIAIGRLFSQGELWLDRYIALSGPSVLQPRIIKTRLGASIADLTDGQLKSIPTPRIISGSVFSGHLATATEAYLGRYHLQITALLEDQPREFLGWLSPGFNKFSSKKLFLSALFPNKKYDFNTLKNGGQRAIVPIGAYEKVMPLQILATYLLKALSIQDYNQAIELGCLELDEEDLALCSFVCPCKNDYGSMLRATLNQIEKEYQ